MIMEKKMINEIYKSQFGLWVKKYNNRFDSKRVEEEINKSKAERKTNSLWKELILVELLPKFKYLKLKNEDKMCVCLEIDMTRTYHTPAPPK